jgi:hypothetical protein
MKIVKLYTSKETAALFTKILTMNIIPPLIRVGAIIDLSLFLVILIQYSQRHTMINHCDRHITLLSDTDTVQSET